MATATPLSQYIRTRYGKKAAFAADMGVDDTVPRRWERRGWMVVGSHAYSPKRRLPMVSDLMAPDELEVVPILDYILEHYPSQAAFARVMKTSKSHVWYWSTGGWQVINNRLYAPRRKLPQEE